MSRVGRGTELVRRWAPRFGLGDFRLRVMERPENTNETAWALSYYDIDELWGVIQLPPDDELPPQILELIVLHELAHGLLQLAASGETGEEQACNRIARLARSDFSTPSANEHTANVTGDEWFEDKFSTAGALDKRAWLRVVADALPEDERTVINHLYFEGLSVRETADAMGMDHRSMRRVRDRALEHLREYFAALESAEWHTARRIIALKQPEAGAEFGTVYEVHHRCSQANALARELGDDVDLLIFPVGNVGYTQPKGIPFPVEAAEPCQACGAEVGAWFVWSGGHTNHPGTLWTP